MMEIEVKRSRRNRTVKIYGRNYAVDQSPVTVTIQEEGGLHLYSHADMTHEDWSMLAMQVTRIILEMKDKGHRPYLGLETDSVERWLTFAASHSQFKAPARA